MPSTRRSTRSETARSWDERTKEIQLANLQSVAQRRLDVAKQVIEDKKLIEIREGKAESERQIRGIRNRVRLEAAVIPPLPPLILGWLVWIIRSPAREPGCESQDGWRDNGRIGMRNLAHRDELEQPERRTETEDTMNELYKTLTFVAVALVFDGPRLS